MKSTIKIDLNSQNEPVIRIELCRTSNEDLRDKTLQRFIERLQGNTFCTLTFTGEGRGGELGGHEWQIAEIRAVPKDKLKDLKDSLDAAMS